MPQLDWSIEEADPASPDAIALIDALDRYLLDAYPGGVEIHGLDPEPFRAAGGVFLIGRERGIPVACGAIRPLEPGVCELKRMYLRPEYRRRGYARAILEALEDIARARNWRTIRLETGIHQPEAMALYQSAGYLPIPLYAGYTPDPRSRYFEKKLP